jgi:hypothetical protein
MPGMTDFPPPPQNPGYQPPQQPGGAPGYGAPGQQYGGGAQYGGGPPKNNIFALLALVLGLAGIITCGTTSLAAIPLGFVGLSQIKNSNGRETGRGMAIGGIVVSIVILVIGIGSWVALVVFADEAVDELEEICEDFDSDNDGINDCDDTDTNFDDFTTSTFEVPG